MTTSNGSGATVAPERLIDLDAARAARAEAQGDPVTLRFGGVEFTLPAEMPADFAMYAQEHKLRECVAALIGDQADQFFALRPSMADIEALCEQAAGIYSVTPGEAPASADS